MTSRLLLPALSLALALTGCDAATTSDAATPEDLEDAADAIASAVALDAGGALDDATTAASAFSLDAGLTAGEPPRRANCDSERSYDESAGLWTVSASCERGNPEGARYHSFARVSTWRFLDADGNPQEAPQGASVVEYGILSGSGSHLTLRSSAELESLGADLTITPAGDGLATVNGTYARDGIRTVYGREAAQREVDYALSLELDEVTGSPSRRNRRAGAVSGTITGLYTATISATAPGGETRTREVEREFTVTFPAEDRARIAIGGRTYDVDAATGDLL